MDPSLTPRGPARKSKDYSSFPGNRFAFLHFSMVMWSASENCPIQILGTASAVKPVEGSEKGPQYSRHEAARHSDQKVAWNTTHKQTTGLQYLPDKYL